MEKEREIERERQTERKREGTPNSSRLLNPPLDSVEATYYFSRANTDKPDAHLKPIRTHINTRMHLHTHTQPQRRIQTQFLSYK